MMNSICYDYVHYIGSCRLLPLQAFILVEPSIAHPAPIVISLSSILSSPHSSYASSDPPLHADILHAALALLTKAVLALLDIDLGVLHLVHGSS